jgi:Domain of unknown function (DUF1816)
MKHLINWFRPQTIRQLVTAVAAELKTGQPWWVEVQTSVPRCTYYFGPFDYLDEARASRAGYVEDLEGEGARDIVVLVKQCQPEVLTIDQGYYSSTGQHH